MFTFTPSLDQSSSHGMKLKKNTVWRWSLLPQHLLQDQVEPGGDFFFSLDVHVSSSVNPYCISVFRKTLFSADDAPNVLQSSPGRVFLLILIVLLLKETLYFLVEQKKKAKTEAIKTKLFPWGCSRLLIFVPKRIHSDLKPQTQDLNAGSSAVRCRTCSCGGDRNSLVFLAVTAADRLSACISSL